MGRREREPVGGKRSSRHFRCSTNGAAYELATREQISPEMKGEGGGSRLRLPRPGATCGALLKALDIQLPKALPYTEARADMHRKVPGRRKPR